MDVSLVIMVICVTSYVVLTVLVAVRSVPVYVLVVALRVSMCQTAANLALGAEDTTPNQIAP